MSPDDARPPREYTTAELRDCIAHVEALVDGGLLPCVPVRLRAMLDTWGADMRAEREDRARLEAEAVERAKANNGCR